MGYVAISALALGTVGLMIALGIVGGGKRPPGPRW